MKAFFPGSFDPLTNGHLNIIQRASKIFTEVFVGVMTNTSKRYLFSFNERIDLINKVISHYDNVYLINGKNKLTINVVNELNINVILRSLRNFQDYDLESQIATINYKMNSKIETLLMLADSRYKDISSTMVKEVAYFGGNIDQFVPKIVADAVREKMYEKK